MVVQSTTDYELHKQQIYQKISENYGEDKAKKFIEMYSARYDKFGRSFIDYNFAFSLMDDYYYVKKVGTRWYAIVGVGGTGKTTIAKNFMYFLDETFDIDRLSMDLRHFIINVDKLFDTKMKAIFMDEPDDTINPNSREGKLLREIFGKIRQQQMFIGICATDLKDIPPYIFRKLDGIIFCPCLGKGMFFKNKPRKGSYVLQRIRNEYSEKGYRVFFDLKKDKGCLSFTTHSNSPLDLEKKDEYLKIKRDDYKKSIQDYLNASERKPEKIQRDYRREMILKMKDKGFSQSKIAEIMGVHPTRIGQILGKKPTSRE